MKDRLIRKEELKSYFIPPLFYGPILGLIISFVSLVDSEFSIPVWKAFVLGLAIAFGIQFFGFILMEVLIRGNNIIKMQKGNFKILEQYGIYLKDDLVFEGEYKGYWIHIYPHREVINQRSKIYFSIHTYYNYPDNLNDIDARCNFDEFNSKKYIIGVIYFNKNTISIIPNDRFKPDFKSAIDFMIDKLQELKLEPLDYAIWEDSYIKPIKEEQELERKERTKQIIKIGKLIDIKYQKPTTNKS